MNKMTKKTIDKTVKTEIYNPKTNYESIEEKINRRILSPGGKTIKNFLIGAYSPLTLPFRIPTLIRKISTGQALSQKRGFYESDNMSYENTCLIIGEISSVTIGLIGLVAYADFSPTDLDYTLPLKIALGTNIASGIYELGRRKQSSQEFKGYKKLKTPLAEEKEVSD